MTNPPVSICVPTYNRADLLWKTLQTISQQDYSPLEILISDNGSTDETEQLCREYVRRDPRIRYFRHSDNIGLHPNYNFCFDRAEGEILCFFHDDDLYEPQIVSRGVAFLQQHPNVGLVCSDWGLLNGAGHLIGAREFKVPPVMPGLQYIDRTLRSGRSSVACSGAVIRRSALGEIRFDEQGTTGFSDFVVWFQIAERAAVGHIHDRLFYYRLHSGSLSRRTIGSIARDYYETLTRYCDAYLSRWPGHAVMVDQWRHYINRYLFWALAYEIGLHFRRTRTSASKGPSAATTFELMNYRLTPQEFQWALEHLRVYKTGLIQEISMRFIDLLLRLRITWPLGWMTRYGPSLRNVLGLT